MAKGKLVVVQTTCELGLLQGGGDVFVGHFVHACFDQVVLLGLISKCTDPSGLRYILLTSSCDHARPPPVEDAFRWCLLFGLAISVEADPGDDPTMGDWLLLYDMAGTKSMERDNEGTKWSIRRSPICIRKGPND